MMHQIAKPIKPQTENLIDRNKRIEAARVSIAEAEAHKENQLLKIDYFDHADKKSKMKQLKRTVDEIMNQRNFLLNERRNRCDTVA